MAQPRDWPGLLQPPTSARVIWVAIDPESGGADGVEWLPTLQLAAGALTAGEPRAEDGALLPTSLGSPVYVPVWEFGRGANVLRVLDCAGQVLPGEWPLQPLTAALRLAFWGWMGIVGLFCAGLLGKVMILLVSARWLGLQGPAEVLQVLGVILGAAALAGGYAVLSRGLREPACSAADLRIVFPFVSSLRPIGILLGVSTGILGAWSVWNALAGFASQSVGWRTVIVLQGLLSMGAAWLCWKCTWAATGWTRVARGWPEEFSRTLCLISCGALGLGLLLSGWTAPRAFLEMGAQAQSWHESMYQAGCKWGATLGALACAPLFGRGIPLVVSLGTSMGASALLGDNYALLLTFPALLLTLWWETRSTSSALAITFRATLAGLSGKIAGRCLGFLFLGEEGTILMEMVLERLFFVVALLTDRKGGQN